MTLKQMNDKALADLSSGILIERKEACKYISNIFFEGGHRWAYKSMQLFTPALLKVAQTDVAAMKPLATMAHLFWECKLYSEALACLDLVMQYKTDMQLSDMKRAWDDWKIPYTHEQEVAVNGLWRFECLLAHCAGSVIVYTEKKYYII
jgi:hypothetical protein